MRIPELSIIMPVYNRDKYIGEAINSLLSQTYQNFELIIINDASTDNSLQIIKSFKDKRIKVLINEQNKGIVFSRNKGLQIAQGEYIAPFDSDDIALPEKFLKQINFLNSNPEFGMIGSWVKLIDENGKLLQKKWKLNAKPERIPSCLLFRNYFAQPSVIIRKEAIPIGGYNPDFEIGEDYIMWINIANKFKTYNLPEYLVLCRFHESNSSNINNDILNKYELLIYNYIYNRIGINIDNQKLNTILKIKNNEKIKEIEELIKIDFFLKEILDKNLKNKEYDQKQLEKEVFNRWIKSCYHASSFNYKYFLLIMRSSLSKIFIKTYI